MIAKKVYLLKKKKKTVDLIACAAPEDSVAILV